MNLLEGRLEHDGERRTVVLGDGIPLQIGRVVEDAPDGGRARAGLRPDDIRVNAREEGIPAGLVASMVLGSRGPDRGPALRAATRSSPARAAPRRTASPPSLPGTGSGSSGPGDAPLLLGAGTAAAAASHLLASSPDQRNHPCATSIRTSCGSWLHESIRADLQRRITRRQALMAGAGGALGLYLAGCGGSTGESGGGGGEEKKTTATNTKIKDQLLISELGRLLWTRPTTRPTPRSSGPKVTVTGLRLQRRAAGQAARRRVEVRHRRPDRLRGQNDKRPGPRARAQPRPAPEHREHRGPFTKSVRPRQQLLGAQGLRDHILLLAGGRLGPAGDARRGVRGPQGRRRSDTSRSTCSRAAPRSPGRPHGLGVLDEHRGPGRARPGRAAAARVSPTSTRSTRPTSNRAVERPHRLRPGLERGRCADRSMR